MSNAKKVEDWWAENPMTYAKTHGDMNYGQEQIVFGTEEMFDTIDQTFYSWNTPLHGHKPFSKIFPYETYGEGKDVLEIGCGLGTMAMLWAQNGVNMTALDLNATSIEQTKKRFELKGLSGEIKQADARELDLKDESFDYTYSWGVLHHSPDLKESVREMMRVLKPGGQFGVMLYNRNSLLQWYDIDYKEGLLHMEKAFLSKLELCSRYGDGGQQEGNPHTYPVTKKEMGLLFGGYAKDISVRILGTDLDHIFCWALPPGLSKLLPKAVLKSWGRRFGWSLWIFGTKD